MIELNSKQRKILEKAAHSLQPVVIVGDAGVTEGLIKMVDTSVKAHELIKIKFNEYKDEKVELTQKICAACDATLVRIIGNVAIVYRPADDPEDRIIKLN
ncbi:MAG: ribosome assembly RNA-binding protein YhbY [Spirochaetaceae bacterium]|nr:ribosome assembly RNA-binding protein YhbY [Spirochaetaceae bacterium]